MRKTLHKKCSTENYFALSRVTTSTPTPNCARGLPPSAQISTMRVRSFETIDPVTVFGVYEGALTLRLEYFRDLEKNYEGKWVIISGTEDLANLRGQGKFLPNGTLTGMVHFDP